MYKNEVDDRALKVNGRQCITSLYGYVIPLDIINGLPYMKMEPNTDEEFQTLPHIIFTGGNEWDPTVLDFSLSSQEGWYNTIKKLDDGTIVTPFDEEGNYRHRTLPKPASYTPSISASDNDDPQDIPLDEGTLDRNPLYDAKVSDSYGLREAYRLSLCVNDRYIPTDDTHEDHDPTTIDAHPTDISKPQTLRRSPRQRKHIPMPKPTRQPHSRNKKTQDLNKSPTKHAVRHGYATVPEPEEDTTYEPPLDDNPIPLTSLPSASNTPHPRELKKKKMDWEALRPFFLHVTADKVRRTFDRTTQFASNVVSGHRIQQTLKSPFPAHNVWRRNEPVASDTIFAEVAAIGSNGQKMAQIFVGRKSLVIDVFGMSTEAQFVNTLEDVIRKRGAMDKLVTDSANIEISKRVKEILRSLCIDDWQSEPHYQHQNFAEHRWHHCKANHKWYMNLRNVDAQAWLLCLEWIAAVMNMTAEKSLQWRPPLEVLTGQTIDISILLCFMFWDVVYVSRSDDATYHGQPGSKKSSEIRGRFVGFSTDVGHALTFKILTDDTKKIICRSRVRLAIDGENNLKLDMAAGDIPQRTFIRSKRDKEGTDLVLPTIDVASNPFNLDEIPEEPNLIDLTELIDLKDSQESTKTGDLLRLNDKAIKDGEPPDKPTSTVKKSTKKVHFSSPLDHQGLKDSPEPEMTQDQRDEAAKFIIENMKNSMKTDNPTVQERLSPEEMIDRTFLMPPQSDGTRVRAKILRRVGEHMDNMYSDPERAAAIAKFKCLINNDYEEVVAYSDIVDYIEQDESWDGIWKFKELLNHRKTKRGSPDYRGAEYNVQVLWETGEITWEPLTTTDKKGVYQTDPVTVAIYADKHNLLDTPGWRLPGLRKRAKTQKRLQRCGNKAKLHSFRNKPVYMFGVLVPRTYEQAMEMDEKNGDTLWATSVVTELGKVDEYDTFTDKGKGYRPGKEYTKIRVHLVFAVKHCGRRRARLVAGGHMTETPIDSVYSSVVSLRGIRILCFLSELNGCETWATDISSAYLESYTQEKVFIIAGPEFGEREGHTLVITKALYGLRSSGLCWHSRFSKVLRKMGFTLSKGEKDIWMRAKPSHYEYIAVYVDDLLIVSKEPQAIIDDLTGPHKFKLKGTGPITYHLGCDFTRDEDGVLCYQPVKYIEKILENYVRQFGKKPKEYSSPLENGDHPELDTSPLLDCDKTKLYQSLIGCLQWLIQIGRIDIATAVMTMSRFRAAPREGHLDRIHRIHGYISKMRYAIIRIRTEEPDHSDIPETIYDWEESVYRGAKEGIPDDIPEPLGKRVVFTSYYDANLYHDYINGKSVTGCLHFVNQTMIDHFSKLQATVETATFGSEYVAARTCTEQVIDIRLTFRYLGVEVAGSTMVFGDNESVVNTAIQPHSKLSKRHNALSYHKTRSAIAAKITRMAHIRGPANPADILSKHWGYANVRETLLPLLFATGPRKKIAPIDAFKAFAKCIIEGIKDATGNLLPQKSDSTCGESKTTNPTGPQSRGTGNG